MSHVIDSPQVAELPPIIRDHLGEIDTVCRKHHIHRLSVIGSILRKDFDPQFSDLDFVIDFERDSPPTREMLPTLDVAEDMRAIFDRPVDVVERPKGTNSRFAREMDATEVVLIGEPPEPIQTTSQRRHLLERDIYVRKAEAYLADILTASDKLQRYVRNKTYPDYLADELLRDGVERNLISIGAAVAKLKKIHPALVSRLSAAQRIVGFRNVLVHVYYELDQSKIWDVLEKHLPILQQEAQTILHELEQQ